MQLRGAGSIAVMLLAALAGAQNSRQTMASAQAPVVTVETIVTDKQGNYLRDLTAKDFRVWEDNKERPVTSASLQSAAAPLQTENRNYVLVLFDNTTTGATRQKQIKAALSEFVNDRKGDLALAVAVYTGGMSVIQNFTSDAEQMRKAIGSVTPPAAQSALAADSAQSASGPSASAASTMVNTGVSGRAGSALAGGASASVQDQTMSAFLYDVAALARTMSSIPGRKALVLLTGGFSVPEQALNQFNAAVRACNQADVAIYPVDVRGLNAGQAGLTGPPGGLWAGLLRRMGVAFALQPVSSLAAFQNRAGAQGQDPFDMDGAKTGDSGMGARQALDSLAAETGGFVIRGSNDLVSGLRKIAAVHGEYYTVAFAPLVDAKAGCHELRVRVSRGGAQVRSRNSYCPVMP